MIIIIITSSAASSSSSSGCLVVHNIGHYLCIALVDSELTTFSHGNLISYSEAFSCYTDIRFECEDDKRSVEGQCLRNIRAAMCQRRSTRIARYLHKSIYTVSQKRAHL